MVEMGGIEPPAYWRSIESQTGVPGLDWTQDRVPVAGRGRRLPAGPVGRGSFVDAVSVAAGTPADRFLAGAGPRGREIARRLVS